MKTYGPPDSIRCGMEQQNHNQKNKRGIGCLIITAILMLSVSALLLSELCDLKVLKRIDQAECDLTGDFVQCYLQHEDMPFDIEFSVFSDLYHRLTQMEYAEYFEIYNQYLSNVPEELYFFDAFTEELRQGCEAANCIQISRNVFDQFHLSVKDGRIWSEDEIIIHGSDNTIPVLLGAGYGNIYEVGDTFTAGYLYDQYQMQVIGFLEADSRITTPQKYMILDQAIIMPSFQVDENTVITDGLKIHYANKTSGLAVLEAGSWEQGFQRLKAMLEDSGAGKYSFGLSPLSVGFEKEYGITLENSLRLMGILEVVCISIVFLCLCKCRGRYNGNTVRMFVLLFAASTIIFAGIVSIGREFGGVFNHMAFPVIINGLILAVSLLIIRRFAA